MVNELTGELPEHGGTSTEEQEMQIIEEFVSVYRERYGITPTRGFKPEGSCICFGEGHNLLYRQLVLTTKGDGDWLSLKDAEIRKLVLDEIAIAEGERK